MSGISFCSAVLEQPQVTGKGKGRDQRCFPASLCCCEPPDHKQSYGRGRESVSCWRHTDLILFAQTGKETEKKQKMIAGGFIGRPNLSKPFCIVRAGEELPQRGPCSVQNESISWVISAVNLWEWDGEGFAWAPTPGAPQTLLHHVLPAAPSVRRGMGRVEGGMQDCRDTSPQS